MSIPKVVYVMGAPGAGKGTQAERVAKELNYHRFSTGDAFRAITRQDTDLGREVKSLIDNGILAPPELAAKIVIAAIAEHQEKGEGLVFDGTPRTVEEAKIVDQFFMDTGYGQPLVFFLAVDREEMIRRNSKRRFCLGINGDFPVINKEDEERCQSLDGTVGTRPDDDPSKFATRWDEFQKRTYPVVEAYRARGLIHEIDGMPDVETVWTQMLSDINKLRNND